VLDLDRVAEVGQDLGRATDPGQAVEAGRDSERVVVLVGEGEPDPAAVVQAQTPEQSRP